LRFHDHYNRADYDTASDSYIKHNVQSLMAPLYPRNYFGAYSGNEWIKEPYYFATNGFEDSKTTTKKYFKCISYDDHAGLNTLNSNEVLTQPENCNSEGYCFQTISECFGGKH